MRFGSDNFGGAHPAIAASLCDSADGYVEPYGISALDESVQQRLCEIFETDLQAFFVTSGTASNSLALAAISKPGGIVLAHHEAHISVDECGAPEFMSGQLRVFKVDGRDGRMDLDALQDQVKQVTSLDVHGGRLNAIAVTQPTESGTTYSLAQLDCISALAKKHNVPMIMDGARFANGLVSLGCSPADMTWKRGVDVVTFGGTKNGCWCAEAVLFFNKNLASEFPYLQKRSGHLLSKTAFICTQFQAYLRGGLWLELARHSNRMAQELATVFQNSTSTRLARRPQANEIFVIITERTVAVLRAAAVIFAEWPCSPEIQLKTDEVFCRFVTFFSTSIEEVKSVEDLLRESAPCQEEGPKVNGVNGLTLQGVNV